MSGNSSTLAVRIDPGLQGLIPPLRPDELALLEESLVRILLVNNSTDTVWWQHAAGAASAVCFKCGRIKFERPGGGAGSPLQGQCFLYFGSDAERFGKRFAEFGLVFEARVIRREGAA